MYEEEKLSLQPPPYHHLPLRVAQRNHVNPYGQLACKRPDAVALHLPINRQWLPKGIIDRYILYLFGLGYVDEQIASGRLRV